MFAERYLLLEEVRGWVEEVRRNICRILLIFGVLTLIILSG